jgi:hypothetical protein
VREADGRSDGRKGTPGGDPLDHRIRGGDAVVALRLNLGEAGGRGPIAKGDRAAEEFRARVRLVVAEIDTIARASASSRR